MDKREKKYTLIYLSVFLIIMTILIEHKNEIDANLAVTKGTIVHNYKGAKGSWAVEINYEVDNICYLHSFSSTSWCQNEECLKTSIKIEYSSKNPNVARAVRENGDILYPAMKIGEQNYQINCDTVFE
jgi:hypothetical protein